MSAGFHAFVGNPPWVSYAGRAAQPLDEGRRRYFDEFFDSFAGYKNLQGVFIERCAGYLRIDGRLGLVVPSSMSEQEGYGPSRLAHDRLCTCDDNLPDKGEDSFAGVFQPSMVLLSTRRPVAIAIGRAASWPVERPDLDADARALVEKMTREPLPPALFGERGLQSAGEDMDHVAVAPDATHTVALRVGGDIQAFQRSTPSLFADPSWFAARLRQPADWGQVKVLIRQTARVPIAAISDGAAFRNSILAGFEDAEHPASFLVAYLNSSPIRWVHFMRHRDARQGMPQMKIGHLRAVPKPPGGETVRLLAELGERLSTQNTGIDAEGQKHLDDIVGNAFGLTVAERASIARWARESL
jgi:hypothetical protein